MGTLLIAGLCLALGCILGYAYSPVRTRLFDPLNQEDTIDNETERVIRDWRKMSWMGPRHIGDEWVVGHNIMEPMLDALDIRYHNDTRQT